MRRQPWLRSREFCFAAVGSAAFVAAFAATQVALAVLGNSPSVNANTLATSTMAAPTGIGAVGGANIVLTWTATPTSYAAGYNVMRSQTSGGPYAQVAQVTPRTTFTYTDSPAAGTYYYVLQSYFQNWVSANSTQTSAGVSTTTGYLSCAAQAADAGGDGNGYETNPANACANDSVFATDASSGTSTATSCTSAAKDKHRFYNYGIALPASSVVNGIEVRLDALKSGTGTAPKLCVQLSWDGGTTWATSKVTPNITGAEATYILGAANNTWGHVWTVPQMTDANFRVRVIDTDNTATQTFQLDQVAVQVTFTPP